MTSISVKPDSQNKTTVYIVDDDELLQRALTRLLELSGYAVRSYSSAGEFLMDQLTEGPACILLDYNLPGPSGLELQEALLKRNVAAPIVFISGKSDIPTAVQAMKRGAVDFLSKPVKKTVLIATIDYAVSAFAQSHQQQEQLDHWRGQFAKLTTRERQIFDGIVSGKLNKELAFELGTSERTIKAHRANVMKKMHAGTFAELVQISVQIGQDTATPA